MVIRVQLLLDPHNGELQIEVPDQSTIRYGQLDLLCRCGERNNPDSVFCSHCGRQLDLTSKYTTHSLTPLSSSSDNSQNEIDKSNNGIEDPLNIPTVILSNPSDHQ